jgi:WD40 repeat protein
VAFSPDGKLVASASYDKTVRLWSVATGEAMQRLQHDGCVLAVDFSPDGQIVVSGSFDKTVRLWNVVTGETQRLEGHEDSVNAVAFSQDGQVVASASYDSTVQLWDAVTGKATQSFKIPRMIKQLTFSADGRFLHLDSAILNLADGVLGPSEDVPTSTASLELTGQWIKHRSKELLWLPHEYRGVCSAARDQTLVIGQKSGAVSFFKLR